MSSKAFLVFAGSIAILTSANLLLFRPPKENLRPILSPLHTVFDTVREGHQAYVDLQIYNPLSEPIVLDRYNVSCGCMSVLGQNDSPAEGLRIEPSSGAPLNLSLSTSGRYGTIMERVFLQFLSERTSHKYSVETMVVIDIQANLRCFPPSILFTAGRETVKTVVYSGSTDIGPSDLSVVPPLSGFAEVLSLDGNKKVAVIDGLVPIAVLEIRRPSPESLEHSSGGVVLRAEKFDSEVILPLMIQDDNQTIKISPSKLFFSRSAEEDKIVRSVYVSPQSDQTLRVENMPTGLKHDIDRTSNPMSITFFIDTAVLFKDRSNASVRVVIGEQSRILEFHQIE